MSTTVDQRVVEMRFDNKQFENNIQTSLSSIDKLKKSLNMDGATKGLESVEKASGKINLSGLSNAVETVNAKFSALEVMAITALANITNSAVNAGKSIVSALTIDPIKTGFQEYETQINAVQTILANTSSKGTTLDQVNNALDELNHYADMTIYNFTEMTRNIGPLQRLVLIWIPLFLQLKVLPTLPLYQVQIHSRQVQQCISYHRH